MKQSGLHFVLYYNGRYDEAKDQLRKTLDFDPTFVNAHLHLGLTYLQTKRYPRRRAESPRQRGNSHSMCTTLVRDRCAIDSWK